MKTTIRNFALSLFLMVGLNAVAAEFDVSVKKGYNLTVTAENMAAETSIFLRDAQGFLLYSQELNNASKVISFENLPDGIYVLYMENELMSEKTRIVKNNAGLAVETAREGIVFKPSFKVVGKKVRMSLTNPAQDKVLFKVYDSKGIEVASVSSEDLVIKKSFDFEAGKSGVYTFVTKVQDQSFSKELSVN